MHAVGHIRIKSSDSFRHEIKTARSRSWDSNKTDKSHSLLNLHPITLKCKFIVIFHLFVTAKCSLHEELNKKNKIYDIFFN